MRFTEGELYHVYNRGNNKQQIFFKEEHFLLFLRKFKAEVAPFCNVLCWCLMSNHFHFMIQANEAGCRLIKAYGGKPMQLLANRIGTCLSSYAQAVNADMSRTGSLFQQHTQAKPVTEIMAEANFHGSLGKYTINLMRYIHQNPVRGGLVRRLEDWPYSSFVDFAGRRRGTLCQPELFAQITECNLSTFYQDSYDALERHN